MSCTRRPTRAAVAAGVVTSLALSLGACTGEPDPGRGRPGAGTAQRQEPASPSEELGLETGWGPTRAELDAATRQVARLDLPELAGQVIVARWSGTGPPTGLVRHLDLGGVIAFSENVTSAGQLRATTRSLQRSSGRPWPVLVGVDQEGGLVERVQGDVTGFPAFMSAGAADRPALTRRAYAASGAELRWMGLNVDFAPDADVTIGPADPAIGSRSAGSDPRQVAAQALAAARGFRQAGVVPVLKHFPGHGSVTTDSHLGLPVQPRSRAELERTDLVPFAAAVDAGLPAVMVGHIAVQAVDPGVPATLSRPVVQGMLRGDLGFDGLVVSDALEMAALAGQRSVAARFLEAGGDVVLLPPDPAAARAEIVRAVRAGDLPRRQLEQSAVRMVALLQHGADVAPRAGGSPGSAGAESRRLSAAAVTVATGPCSGVLATEALVPMGNPTAVAAFRAAATSAGLRLGSVTYELPPRPRPTGKRKKDQAALARWRAIEPTPVVGGTPIRFDTTGGLGGPGVLVATGTPYLLGYADEPVEIATYGTTPGAMGALVEVLRGRAAAPGSLPVQVEGVARRGC